MYIWWRNWDFLNHKCVRDSRFLWCQDKFCNTFKTRFVFWTKNCFRGIFQKLDQKRDQKITRKIKKNFQRNCEILLKSPFFCLHLSPPMVQVNWSLAKFYLCCRCLCFARYAWDTNTKLKYVTGNSQPYANL